MERENLNPSELTGQGQNTYSKYMPDGGNGPDIGQTPDQSAGQGGRRKIELSESEVEQYKRNARDQGASPQRREAAKAILELAGISLDQNEQPAANESTQSSAPAATEAPQPQTPQEASAQRRRSSTFGEEGDGSLKSAVTGRYGSGGPEADRAMGASTREERDEVFNDIFLALDSQPRAFSQDLMSPFTAAGETYQNFINSLGRLATGPEGKDLSVEQLKAIKEDYERFQSESEARRILHDITSILYIPGVKGETLFGYAEKFESSLVDMAFTTPGFREMTDFYEYAIRESMATHEIKGYLDPEKIRAHVKSETVVDKNGVEQSKVTVVASEIDKRTMDLFREFMNKGLLKSRTKDGKEFTLQGLKDWEINRIFNIARGSMIASGRMISLAAESKLPPSPTRFASGFLQDIVQEYSALKHLNGKWTITVEGLAAYLYEGTTGNVQKDRLLQRWNPGELKELWERFEENPDKMLNSLERVFYLGRMNPNRAGDVWTWMSWRGENKSDAVTMTQNFLKNGEVHQAQRWNAKHPPKDGQPSAEEYIAFMQDPHFKVSLSDEEFFELSKEDRGKLKHDREHHADKKAAWAKAHPNAIGFEEFEKFYNEYQNWTGTGFRFEKMRTDLAKAVDYTTHYHGSDAEIEKERKKAIDKGMSLLSRMADLQGHRLYGKSHYIRERLDGQIKENPKLKSNLTTVLADVQMTEAAFLNAREELLDRGIMFNDVQLDMADKGFDFFDRAITEDLTKKDEYGVDVKDEYGNSIVILSRDERIKLAKEFVGIVREDFAQNKEKYKDEFITKREYTHGFVLWTGDVPVDEYNATSVGPTGAFVRRARDNKNQGLATGAETKLLDNLKNIHNAAQLEEVFEEIFASIDHYDRGKAQQAIAEKMLGILRFYKVDSIAKIPFAGLMWKNMKPGKVSFARMMYGNHALALESSEINKIVQHFAHTKKITHEQEKWLLDQLGATKKHLIYELGLDATELTTLAMLMELFSVIGHEIGAGVEDFG